MKIRFDRVKELLQDFEFQKVFIEELGWSNPPKGLRRVTFAAKPIELTRQPVAQLAGFVVFEVSAADGSIPDAKGRLAAHKVIGELHHEHVLVFVDRDRKKSVWSWIHRKDGKDQPRTHYYFNGQPGDLFIGKLGAMMFDLGDFDVEGNIAIRDVASRVRAALNVEKVTQEFYRKFQEQHDAFLDLVIGIPDPGQRRWYVSVLLNRLMFIYFLQKKGFLDDGNLNYLRGRLDWSQQELGPNRYFKDFLRLLFFEGFAKPAERRSPEARARLGRIRYLNGGLFLPHRIEITNRDIDVPDLAFERLFALFESYSWHLDDTPGNDDSTINPDVLGNIFEKYINQKSFGAYYTRPEITDWLCEQTIHRAVLDRVCLPGGEQIAFPDGSPARFESVPDLLLKLTPDLCRQLLFSVLPSLSVLDPACGSGAFLVAALKTLHGIYGAVVGAVDTLPDKALKTQVAEWRQEHPSLGYFLKRQIITRNLYGVDLMEEATEIARLRLFLSLVSSASREEELEPLPNIDFNIMPGNSLVGLLHVKDDQKSQKRALKMEDIRALHPFHWDYELDDVIREKGGFDVILANVVAGKRSGTDLNLYKLFVEQCLNLLRSGGQLGMVIPGSLYGDIGAMKLREVLLEKNTVRALFGLSNEKYLFKGLHHSFKVCLLVAAKGGKTGRFVTAFRINPREAIDAEHLPEFLRDPREHLTLTPEFVRKTSPDSLSLMELKGPTDVAVVERMLRLPLLGDDVPGAWKAQLCRELHMTDDAGLFKTSPAPGRLPLYEGKMIHQYNWRFGEPRYWIDGSDAREALRSARLRRARNAAAEQHVELDVGAEDRLSLDMDAFRIAFREVARNTDERSMICTVLPPRVVAGHTLVLHRPWTDLIDHGHHRESPSLTPAQLLYLTGVLDSFVADWFLRQRIAAHLTMFQVYQLPVPRLTEADPRLALIATRAAMLTCTSPEFDDLARSVGLASHKEGVTHPEGRARLRAEIDGLVAHLYGLTEHEFAHILRTFPVVPEPVRVAAHNAWRAVARGDVQ